MLYSNLIGFRKNRVYYVGKDLILDTVKFFEVLKIPRFKYLLQCQKEIPFGVLWHAIAFYCDFCSSFKLIYVYC